METFGEGVCTQNFGRGKWHERSFQRHFHVGSAECQGLINPFCHRKDDYVHFNHPENPHIRNGKIARLLIFFCRYKIPFFSRLYTLVLNCDIACALPKSIFFPHPFGIVINRTTSIGENCVIGHQVTLGARGLDNRGPVLERNVYLGAGAKVLGSVRIGKNSYVGANAVVTIDVPPNATVVGANRILSRRPSFITESDEDSV